MGRLILKMRTTAIVIFVLIMLVFSACRSKVVKEKEDINVGQFTEEDFDNHKVHDPCILPYKGKFYLYYKGDPGK